MKKNNGDKSSSEILRQKAEELLKEKSEAKILELIEELAFQNEEKAQRADELLIANKELAFQNEEKAKRANELLIANKELDFQNEEKAMRAKELILANRELAMQSELILANNKTLKLTHEIETHQIELEMQNKELSFAKEKAETDARKYAQLYDSAPSGYFTLSHDGTIIEVNICGATMLGKDRPKLKSNRFGLFVSNTTRPIFNLFLDELFSGKANKACDVTLSIPGNIPMYVHLTGVVNENGKECLVTMVDITESRMVVELHQSHARFSAMISNISDVIAIMDADGFKKYESPNLKKHFGWLPEDNAGRSAFSFIHPDDMEYALKDFYSVLGEDRSVKTMEFRFECKDGSYKPIELTASNLLNDPLINGIMVSFRDITDRKIAEETLRENDARYSSMISNISDVIGIMGADGIMTYKSSNIEKWFGWLPQDRVGTSGFSTVHPDDMEYVGKVFYSLLEKDNAIATLEFRYQCKDGSYKPIELTAANLLNDPAINGVLLNYHDITGRRQTENILRKTNAQLESAVVTANEMTQLAEASSKSKSTFLANMSHEIRTPLNAIIGFSQLMNREKSLTDSQRKYVTSINSAGEHLLKLINDILELSKLGAGRMEINPTNFDLHAVFNEVQMMFKELSLSKRLQLVVELSGDLPHDVIADSHKLRQILINLIGNAIKFTDKGSIFVRASVDKRNKDTSRLVVEIQDTGPGISEDELGKLFKQFEQTSAGILKNSGTGLGLALSRELAVLMGGNITVASEEGKGSVFTIHVVLKEGKSEVSEAANAKRVICIDNPQKAYRVLVVDDKQENRQVVVNLLNLTGFETKEAVNGEDAIAKFEAWEPHLILMDMRMPVMDGFEAIRLIKSTEKGRHTPVIAVTASTIEDHEKKGFNLDIQGCILKPFHENELFSAIGSVLGIEYIYEEEKPVNALSGYPDNAARLDEDLAKLPDDLILLMLTAVKSANLSHLIEIINGIEIDNSELSKHLMTLAVDYKYDRLLQLLNKRK